MSRPCKGLVEATITKWKRYVAAFLKRAGLFEAVSLMEVKVLMEAGVLTEADC